MAPQTCRDGKVNRHRVGWWATRQNFPRPIFYRASGNDLPLRRLADQAVAVDADGVLRAEAKSRGWPVISLRTEPLVLI